MWPSAAALDTVSVLHKVLFTLNTKIRSDRLSLPISPQVLGGVGALPDIFTELEISYFLLRRLLGVRTEGDKKGAKVGIHETASMYFSSTSLDCSHVAG